MALAFPSPPVSRPHPSIAGCALPLLQLLHGARPIALEQARERAIGEQAALGLAARAVIALALGVDDALHGGAADRTRLPVAPVDRHALAKRRDVAREAFGRFPDQPLRPLAQHRPARFPEPRRLRILELPRLPERREPGAVENLVGVGVADPADRRTPTRP